MADDGSPRDSSQGCCPEHRRGQGGASAPVVPYRTPADGRCSPPRTPILTRVYAPGEQLEADVCVGDAPARWCERRPPATYTRRVSGLRTRLSELTAAEVHQGPWNPNTSYGEHSRCGSSATSGPAWLRRAIPRRLGTDRAPMSSPVRQLVEARRAELIARLDEFRAGRARGERRKLRARSSLALTREAHDLLLAMRADRQLVQPPANGLGLHWPISRPEQFHRLPL